jgi:hypothetical protein
MCKGFDALEAFMFTFFGTLKFVVQISLCLFWTRKGKTSEAREC